MGNFVQAGSPGIGLNRPLVAGEFIFVIDLQGNITGPAVVVQQSAPIPDVNPWGAAAMAIGLTVALALRLRAARSA